MKILDAIILASSVMIVANGIFIVNNETQARSAIRSSRVGTPEMINPHVVQVDNVYDGDTFHFTMPGLWPELAKIGVRVRGVDTPEIRGKCASEIAIAKAARQFTYSLMATTKGQVTLYNVKWDKYGGRIDADVVIGNTSLASALIQNGFARPYYGGKRTGWCNG